MAKKEKEPKTNAVRMVAAKKIPYKLHTYDAPDGFLDGVSVAKQTGQNPDTVFKTLVLVGHSKAHYVCVIPVACELDLKKAAKHFGEKNIEMIHAKEITPLTGYIKGGCSPIGMKKLFPTVIHESARYLPAICVSGGKVGLQMELSPDALLELAQAGYADIIKA
ncbi:Cys-tRNA(Pro) deacylase [Ihubacter sp. rT4E-8]|uniref:Cys-tRNA(Pro) deacylase n=1 Tax=unclassified Ihubacter TaxID=2633299 RepID=UPI00137AB7DD